MSSTGWEQHGWELLGGGAERVTPSAILGVPDARRGMKIRNGYPTLAISGAHVWAKWLHNPYRLGGSPTPSAGRKAQVATSPLLSREPTCGQSGYITPAILGVPNAKRGKKIRYGYLTLAVVGAHMWTKQLGHRDNKD